jgi:hypothetical protein
MTSSRWVRDVFSRPSLKMILWRCAHAVRPRLKHKHIFFAANTIRKSVLTKEDPHPFWHCMVEGIEHWTATGDSSYMPDVTGYPPHLREAYQEAAVSQQGIGWDNALRGFFSTEWLHLTSNDMDNADKYCEPKGNARLRKAMSRIYEYTKSTWEHRNAMLHTKESTAMAVSIRSAAHVEIKHYHGRPNLLRSDDRPLSKLLDGSPSAQRRWLRLVRKSMEACQREGRTQTTMTSFFARKPPTITGGV